MIVIALVLIALTLGFGIGLAVRMRALEKKLQAFEHRLAERPLPVLAESEVRLLQGLRVALLIDQDHPQPVFAALLKEALLREDALVGEENPDLTVGGRIVSNGYADVYFRADLTVSAEGQPLFTLAEKPPHGDRPENLAREVVARIKDELETLERRGALRELGL